MKMISQLTRQAMNRHRLLSAVSFPGTSDAPAAPPPVSPQPVRRSLYTQKAADLPAPSAPTAPIPTPPPVQIPQQRTIYGELMKKHDRFTERHLTGR